MYTLYLQVYTFCAAANVLLSFYSKNAIMKKYSNMYIYIVKHKKASGTNLISYNLKVAEL